MSSRVRKIVIGSALVLIVAVALYAWKSVPNVTNYPPRNTSIAAFGDSLTNGVGSQNFGFVGYLANDFHTAIAGFGVVGDTTESALSRQNQIKDSRWGVVILLLGGNDFLQGIPEEKTFANLAKIIETIHASGAVALLVGIESNRPGNNHRQRFDQLAQQYNTAYVPDILDGIYDNPEMMSDSLNPYH